VATFSEAGTYNVTLTITDAEDQIASDSIEITVEEGEGGEGEAAVVEEEGGEGEAAVVDEGEGGEGEAAVVEEEGGEGEAAVVDEGEGGEEGVEIMNLYRALGDPLTTA
jgi:PKD repeat protein